MPSAFAPKDKYLHPGKSSKALSAPAATKPVKKTDS